MFWLNSVAQCSLFLGLVGSVARRLPGFWSKLHLGSTWFHHVPPSSTLFSHEAPVPPALVCEGTTCSACVASCWWHRSSFFDSTPASVSMRWSSRSLCMLGACCSKQAKAPSIMRWSFWASTYDACTTHCDSAVWTMSSCCLIVAVSEMDDWTSASVHSWWARKVQSRTRKAPTNWEAMLLLTWRNRWSIPHPFSVSSCNTWRMPKTWKRPAATSMMAGTMRTAGYCNKDWLMQWRMPLPRSLAADAILAKPWGFEPIAAALSWWRSGMPRHHVAADSRSKELWNRRKHIWFHLISFDFIT